MKLPVLASFFVLTAITGSFAQSRSLDSLKLVVLGSRLDSLSNSINRINRTNDSLNKELFYFRAKEDYFALAVDRQGAHFEWFIGIILTIAVAGVGFFSYRYFNDIVAKQNRQFEDRFNDFQERSTKIENSYQALRIDFFVNMATIMNNLISVVWINEKSMEITSRMSWFITRITGTKFYFDAYTELSDGKRKSISYDRITDSLKKALNELKRLETEAIKYENVKPTKEILDRNIDYIISKCREIAKINDDAIIKDSLEINSRINALSSQLSSIIKARL